MILKNAKFYSEGLIRKGTLLIKNGLIEKIIFNTEEQKKVKLAKKDQDEKELDCENKLILPGIIDIHSHLRDMDQSEKETFLTGTKAAAFSGITTVFTMPNTIPPAITSEQVALWMKKATQNIYVDVGFIAGVPKEIDEEEVKKIIELGAIGFKIYPLDSINGVDWKEPKNLQHIFDISSKYQIPIFIHASYPLLEKEKETIRQDFDLGNISFLECYNRLDPVKAEEKYVKFVIENYEDYASGNKLTPKNYPIIHFCHVSCIESYLEIKKSQEYNSKISFEVTPHHLLLSNKIKLDNSNYGKVLPPLRDLENSVFLFNELKKGEIEFIGTDHAPHTLAEKAKHFSKSPSGFPGFETYPLLLLDKVFNFQLSLENFVKVASENPAKTYNLKNKGFIKEGYDADLLIVDKITEYAINPQKFKTKAKFSPFENFKTTVEIWKVFLRGIEINIEDSIPTGKIIKRIL
jgi:dihydroorotase